MPDANQSQRMHARSDVDSTVASTVVEGQKVWRGRVGLVGRGGGQHGVIRISGGTEG